MKSSGLAIATIFACLVLMNGCASVKKGCANVKEGAKGLLGVSTKVLEDMRPQAMKESFKCDYAACWDKVEMILKRGKAYIYAKEPDKGLIAVYVSAEDTTPVGVFFTKIDKENTRVEVSSPSTFGKEKISKIVFQGLLKELSPKKEGKAEEKKE